MKGCGHPRNLSVGTEETLRKVSLYPDRDSKTGLPEYEAAVSTQL
jgi:hypothetical protein